MRLPKDARRWIERKITGAMGRLRLRWSMRDSDVFLVTYPKSGTNWVGFFLASIIAERESGEHDRFDLVTFREWVPDINKEYSSGKGLLEYERLSDPRVFTVHASYDPALPRVIYLVRDPRAVMASFYWHHRRERSDFGLSMEEFIEENDMWPGDWAAHVAGWLDRDAQDVLVVRYEDLQRDPATHFGRIVDFVDLHPADDLDKYIQAASFESMAASEPDRDSKDVPFIRRGEANSWKEELPEASIRLIEERYEEIMGRLGYEQLYG